MGEGKQSTEMQCTRRVPDDGSAQQRVRAFSHGAAVHARTGLTPTTHRTHTTHSSDAHRPRTGGVAGQHSAVLGSRIGDGSSNFFGPPIMSSKAGQVESPAVTPPPPPPPAQTGPPAKQPQGLCDQSAEGHTCVLRGFTPIVERDTGGMAPVRALRPWEWQTAAGADRGRRRREGGKGSRCQKKTCRTAVLPTVTAKLQTSG